MKFARHYLVTFTVTIASPGVFTKIGHELYDGDTIGLFTTGDLPTGLAVDTTYYVIKDGITANTFQIATSKGGTPINTSGSQSGTQSYLKMNNARLTPARQDNK